MENFKYQLSVSHLLNNDLNLSAALAFIKSTSFKVNTMLERARTHASPAYLKTPKLDDNDFRMLIRPSVVSSHYSIGSLGRSRSGTMQRQP